MSLNTKFGNTKRKNYSIGVNLRNPVGILRSLLENTLVRQVFRKES